MRISYRMTYRDLITFNFYHYLKSPFLYGLSALVMAVVAYPNWSAVMKTADEHSLFAMIFAFAVMELMWIPFVFAVFIIIILLGSIGQTKEGCTITLTDDAILTETEYSCSELKWPAVKKLVKTKTFVYIYVTKSAALTIPKRAFATDEEREQFWAYCVAHAPLAHKALQRST